jgi:histone H3/H4
MFPILPLKKLLREKLTKQKLPRMVETSAVQALNEHLTMIADKVSEEASNGNYHKVTSLDVDRGVELLRMRAVRDYLKDKDSLAAVYGEVDAKVRLIERGAR